MQKQNLEKEKLLLEAAQKDKAKFAELYQYYLNDVYRFSFSLVGNQHDAEDITSSTLTAMFNNLEKFKWQGISLKYWLFKTAKNNSLSLYKKSKKNTDFDEDFTANDSGFENEVLDKDELSFVVNEIERLKPNEREVINLRVWEELSFDEIAQITNEKPITIRQRFYRAIEKVKVSLSEKNYQRFAIDSGLMWSILNQAGSIYKVSPEFAASISKNIDSLISGAVITTGFIGGIYASIKTFVSQNAIASLLLGTTAVAATTGGYLVYENYYRRYDDSIQQVVYKEYKDEQISISFNLPETFKVEKKSFTEYGNESLIIADERYFEIKEKAKTQPYQNPNKTFYFLEIRKTNIEKYIQALNRDFDTGNDREFECYEVDNPIKKIEDLKNIVVLDAGGQLAMLDGKTHELNYKPFKEIEGNTKRIRTNNCEFPWAQSSNEKWEVIIHLPENFNSNKGNFSYDEKQIDQFDYIVKTIKPIQ